MQSDLGRFGAAPAGQWAVKAFDWWLDLRCGSRRGERMTHTVWCDVHPATHRQCGGTSARSTDTKVNFTKLLRCVWRAPGYTDCCKLARRTLGSYRETERRDLPYISWRQIAMETELRWCWEETVRVNFNINLPCGGQINLLDISVLFLSIVAALPPLCPKKQVSFNLLLLFHLYNCVSSWLKTIFAQFQQPELEDVLIFIEPVNNPGNMSSEDNIYWLWKKNIYSIYHH